MDSWDVIVIGGGPAGLSAALVLGRCNRRVLVFDDGRYRNAATHAVNGLMSRDGVEPARLLAAGRQELKRYNVEVRHERVVRVRKLNRAFAALTETGAGGRARKLLLATGMCDQLPQVEGFAEIYGTSGFHCPVCDAWELRDRPLAALGDATYAVGLLTWSKDIVLFTNGKRVRTHDAQRLRQYGVQVRTSAVQQLESRNGILRHVVLRTGERVPRRALFFHLGHYQRSDLPTQLGCAFKRTGAVLTNRVGETSVPGVFMIGDASGDAQFVSVAMAEGTKAGYALNKSMREEDYP